MARTVTSCSCHQPFPQPVPISPSREELGHVPRHWACCSALGAVVGYGLAGCRLVIAVTARGEVHAWFRVLLPVWFHAAQIPVGERSEAGGGLLNRMHLLGKGCQGPIQHIGLYLAHQSLLLEEGPVGTVLRRCRGWGARGRTRPSLLSALPLPASLLRGGSNPLKNGRTNDQNTCQVNTGCKVAFKTGQA